jgi:hypothetical protein
LGAPQAGWYAQHFKELERIMQRFGDAQKPIWVTETGYGTADPPFQENDQDSPYVDESTQAEAVRMLYQVKADFPQVERIFWWSLRDYYHDTSAANPAMEAHYGLVRSNFLPKPAYWTFAQLTNRDRAVLRRSSVTDGSGTARLIVPGDFIKQTGLYVVFVMQSVNPGQTAPPVTIVSFYSASTIDKKPD